MAPASLLLVLHNIAFAAGRIYASPGWLLSLCHKRARTMACQDQRGSARGSRRA